MGLLDPGDPVGWMVFGKPLAAGAAARTDITPTHIVTNSSTTDGTSVNTASLSPTTGRLQLIGILSHNGSQLNGPPTVTGCGLTWVEVINDVTTVPTRRLTVLRAMGTASTGALTIDFGADTQTSFCWSWIEFAGTDTSGTNGSGAVVQSAATVASSGTDCTNTLAAFENAKNIHVAFIGTSNAITADAAFAELGNTLVSNSTTSLESEWLVNAITVAATNASSAASVTIGIEVKAG